MEVLNRAGSLYFEGVFGDGQSGGGHRFFAGSQSLPGQDVGRDCDTKVPKCIQILRHSQLFLCAC